MLADQAGVGLELGDQERQAGDLGREAFDLDAVEVGERDQRLRVVARVLDDLMLNLAHLPVGDNQEVARAAGGIEHADAADAPAKRLELAHAVPRLGELLVQLVQEQRVQHLQNVGHAGVVHAKRAALVVVGHRLDHRAEDVRVDLLPVEFACV